MLLYLYVFIFCFFIFCNSVYYDIIFPFFVYYVFHFLVTVVTKKKEKKSTGAEVDSDSEEDEESDESTVKELKKKQSRRRTLKPPNVSITVPVRLHFRFFFTIPFILISFSHFFCILCFPFLGYGSNKEKRKEEFGYRSRFGFQRRQRQWWVFCKRTWKETKIKEDHANKM